MVVECFEKEQVLPRYSTVVFDLSRNCYKYIILWRNDFNKGRLKLIERVRMEP